MRGWRTEGNFPYALKQSVIIAGPHTHSVDFFLGLAVRKKMHFEFVQFLGKKELFNPITGWFFRLLGGHPVNRSKKSNMVVLMNFIGDEKIRGRQLPTPC